MSEPIRLHDLAPALGVKRERTRVGRDEVSKDKTVGRGIKDTRAHKQASAALEGGQMPLYVRLPELRDFKNLAKVTSQVVNALDLECLFPNSGDITIIDLVVEGATCVNQSVKTLGDGDINISVSITAAKSLGSTRSKVEATGGSIIKA